MKNSVIVPKSTVEWLLEKENPSVRNLTKLHLLKQSLSEQEIAEVNTFSPIKQLLEGIQSDGLWQGTNNPYHKYTGDYWQFIFLRELQATVTDQILTKTCPKIASFQLESGGFSHKKGYNRMITCLTANLIHSFLYFGYNDDKIIKGLNLITNSIIEHQGVICDPNPTYNLLSDCQMALTKVLGMASQLKPEDRDSSIKKAIKIIEQKLLENEIYKYIPVGASKFYKEIKNKKTSEIRKIREKYVADINLIEKGVPKKSWLKFGFPHSYTSDILETLYYVAKLDLPFRSEYSDALKIIISKMQGNGRWINENNLKSPMLVTIEPKSTSSKWITYRACFVLQKYSNLEFK